MIEQGLKAVKSRAAAACSRVGRRASEIEFVLVTKGVQISRIHEAFQLGVRDFGENRVQELIAKRDHLPKDIRWHFIGHLQTNKVKFLVGRTFLIHSCDRLDLANEIQKHAEKENQVVQVLIQVNTSGEKTKYGFLPDETRQIVPKIAALDRLIVRGLMTIGPRILDQERTRYSFRLLRVLKDRLQDQFPKLDWHYLSMGMSADFELAIEEGANLLRMGTAVFGKRCET